MSIEVLKIKKNPTIRNKILAQIVAMIQPSNKSEWTNGYTDYNERWINQPAWSEHIDRSYRDYNAPAHNDHADTHKGR